MQGYDFLWHLEPYVNLSLILFELVPLDTLFLVLEGRGPCTWERQTFSFNHLKSQKRHFHFPVELTLCVAVLLMCLLTSHTPQAFQGELKIYRKRIQQSTDVNTFYSVPHQSRQWLTRRVLELTQLYELLLSTVPQRIEVIIMQKLNTQAVSPSRSDNDTDNLLGVYFFLLPFLLPLLLTQWI